jgi:aminobenzoyl-glutamate utilization protein A
MSSSLRDQVVLWRRDFHRYPELGYREFRTAGRVCEVLASIPGCTLRTGREAMDPAGLMNPPSPAEFANARAEAISNGASPAWVERMGDGLTGVVAEFKFPQPGPTLAFRVDMDALPILESTDPAHLPAREGFASCHAGRMHACGHDGHTAIGLGLARLVPELGARWRGKLKIVFQPAEEGCAGAKAMVAAGIFSDVDHLVAGHLGTGATRNGLIACGTDAFLATTKFDVEFRGRAAHAGMAPHDGRNALLAAATFALQLHALPRHTGGDTRVNAGTLRAGSGRNVIADHAVVEAEVRGTTAAVNRFMTEEAFRVARAAAEMHGVTCDIRLVGEAGSAPCDASLKAIVRDAAQSLSATREIVDTLPLAGSEDATLMMQAVQERGGQATYLQIGTPLPAGHHHPRFDIDENALWHGVELYAAIADRILGARG